MRSDNRQPTQPPTVNDIMDAYRAYRDSHAAYLRTLRHHTRVMPSQEDGLFAALLDRMPTVRVVHAVANAYISTVVLCLECSATIAAAEILGLIARPDEASGHVVTDRGAEALRRWIDHVAPLRHHHAHYAELWDLMTSWQS